MLRRASAAVRIGAGLPREPRPVCYGATTYLIPVLHYSLAVNRSTDSSAIVAVPHPNRVLIADDDADLLALIGFALRNAGFQVVAASDGASALEIFEREPFALMILDVMMPGADGFAVCAAVRTRSSTPVIMLSARNSEHDIVRALEIGADDYVTKPFSRARCSPGSTPFCAARKRPSARRSRPAVRRSTSSATCCPSNQPRLISRLSKRCFFKR